MIGNESGDLYGCHSLIVEHQNVSKMDVTKTMTEKEIIAALNEINDIASRINRKASDELKSKFGFKTSCGYIDDFGFTYESRSINFIIQI